VKKIFKEVRKLTEFEKDFKKLAKRFMKAYEKKY